MDKTDRELFIISDLHVGGRYGKTENDRGFRMNTHVADLTQFVKNVAAVGSQRKRHVELVINGDFVDFLAQQGPAGHPWRAFVKEPLEAVSTFNQIVEQDTDLFTALKDLLAGGTDLTLVLGNHDVELSLPAVRQRLSDTLEVNAKGKLRFVYDGEAYVVGNVLIEHGNRYDGFNVIDQDRLRRLRSAQSRRQEPNDDAEFLPPPGSQLVEKVMNPIKVDYPFVDLLKPETEAVIPLLIALEPGFASEITRLWRLWRLKSSAGKNAPVAPAWPAHASQIGAPQPESVPTLSLRDMLQGHIDPSRLDRLMNLTERIQSEQEEGSQHIGAREDLRRAWSMLQLNRKGLAWEERRRILLDALRTLQSDTSFVRSEELPEYLDHAKQLASKFGVVLFGHTHLAKEVLLKDEEAVYINTGTWADLMKVPTPIFDPIEANAFAALDQFVNDLRQGDLQKYLFFEPSFAHVIIGPEDKAISARLHSAGPAGLGELYEP